MADAAQISQLCSILMDNAIRYSKPDTKISVSLHKSGKQVVLTVTNQSSQQITDHDLKHLFADSIVVMPPVVQPGALGLVYPWHRKSYIPTMAESQPPVMTTQP